MISHGFTRSARRDGLIGGSIKRGGEISKRRPLSDLGRGGGGSVMSFSSLFFALPLFCFSFRVRKVATRRCYRRRATRARCRNRAEEISRSHRDRRRDRDSRRSDRFQQRELARERPGKIYYATTPVLLSFSLARAAPSKSTLSSSSSS